MCCGDWTGLVDFCRDLTRETDEMMHTIGKLFSCYLIFYTATTYPVYLLGVPDCPRPLGLNDGEATSTAVAPAAAEEAVVKAQPLGLPQKPQVYTLEGKLVFRSPYATAAARDNVGTPYLVLPCLASLIECCSRSASW